MAELRGRKKTTGLDLCIIQDLPWKLLSLRPLAEWMDLRVRWQRQKISSQSQREAKARLQLFQKGRKSGLFGCVIIEEGKTFQRRIIPPGERKRVASKKGIFTLSEIVGISGLGTVFPGSIHYQVLGFWGKQWLFQALGNQIHPGQYTNSYKSMSFSIASWRGHCFFKTCLHSYTKYIS